MSIPNSNSEKFFSFMLLVYFLQEVLSSLFLTIIKRFGFKPIREGLPDIVI